jgi:hypothetical protein
MPMTDKPFEYSANRRNILVRRLLFALCLMTGLESGAGLFEARVIVPLWSESAEAARSWTEGTRFVAHGVRFFGIFSPLLLLTTIVTLTAGWRAPQPVRKWLLAATGIVLALLIPTFIYFVPGQIAMQGAAPTEFSDVDLEAKIHLWTILNWIRQIAGIAAFGCALHALGLSYRHGADR